MNKYFLVALLHVFATGCLQTGKSIINLFVLIDFWWTCLRLNWKLGFKLTRLYKHEN